MIRTYSPTLARTRNSHSSCSNSEATGTSASNVPDCVGIWQNQRHAHGRTEANDKCEGACQWGYDGLGQSGSVCPQGMSCGPPDMWRPTKVNASLPDPCTRRAL